jgi:integral membrane protein (TIGR01906 family)
MVLIIWALIDFDGLFLLFHYISFSNNLWILDPSKDYLIMMFPEGFFNDAAILIVSTIIGVAVIIWIAAFLVNKKLVRQAAAAG